MCPVFVNGTTTHAVAQTGNPQAILTSDPSLSLVPTSTQSQSSQYGSDLRLRSISIVLLHRSPRPLQKPGTALTISGLTPTTSVST